MPWYYIVILCAYGGTIISLIAVVLSENRNPVKSLAWITVLLMLPILGVVFYIFFGRSLKNTRMITRRNRRKLRKREVSRRVNLNRLPFTYPSIQQMKLAHTLTGALYYEANAVDIFTGGREKFEALLADIASARSYVHLQYYIIDDDTIGNRLADALIERARAGVKVRVIYDHIGSIHLSRKFIRRLRDAGVDMFPFFKVNFPHFATRINWRNHRKLAIIDGRVGYIGGMNVADRYISGTSWGCWRDTHLRIQGPAVGALQYSFAVDWCFMGQPLLDEGVDLTAHLDEVHNAGIQMLTSGPTSQWSNIAMVFHKAIASAKRYVYIQTPYFLPTEGLLRTLQTVALAQVDVRIMMPAKSDSTILTYASRSYIQECLRAGIKVYLYEAGMLHAKTVVVDDEFVSVGSTNFDFRSFEHNFEANVFIYSADVNARMRAIFHDDLKQCARISPADWKLRPPWQKTKESVVRLLSPIL